MQHHGAERRRRPVGPDRVDRIVGRPATSARAGCRAGFGQPLGAVDGVQPRANSRACAPARRLASSHSCGGCSTRCSIAKIARVDFARAPAPDSGRRRRATARSASTMASPAEPVKPVSQASRSAQGGTYSFWKRSARGTTKPSSPRRASSARNAATRGALAPRSLAILERLETRLEHARQSRSGGGGAATARRAARAAHQHQRGPAVEVDAPFERAARDRRRARHSPAPAAGRTGRRGAPGAASCRSGAARRLSGPSRILAKTRSNGARRARSSARRRRPR